MANYYKKSEIPQELQRFFCPAELGLEETPEAYIATMVEVFRELRRVLRSDGTFWLNIGDSYASNWPCNRRNVVGAGSLENGKREARPPRMGANLKDKDLMMIPARLAIALQADGWWLRSDIIWHKKAPMPESVTDRPTSAHEHVFLLSKSATYFYDNEAVKERSVKGAAGSTFTDGKTGTNGRGRVSLLERHADESSRNQRNVWTLGPDPSPEAHFATFPREIPRRAILAGTSEHGVCAACGAPWGRVVERDDPRRSTEYLMAEKTPKDQARSGLGLQSERSGLARPGWRNFGQATDTTTGWRPTCGCDAAIVPAVVLDPFLGSGRTLEVAKKLGRQGVGIELNETYIRELAIPKCRQQSLFAASVREESMIQLHQINTKPPGARHTETASDGLFQVSERPLL